VSNTSSELLLRFAVAETAAEGVALLLLVLVSNFLNTSTVAVPVFKPSSAPSITSSLVSSLLEDAFTVNPLSNKLSNNIGAEVTTPLSLSPCLPPSSL
jgi:hypothetical protein